jgi:hypothetical protein
LFEKHYIYKCEIFKNIMGDEYTLNNSDLTPEDNQRTLQSFFKIKAELIKRELRWKGLDIINGKLERVSDPVAPDHFISSLTNTLSSVMGEHNVLTKVNGEEMKVILMEKYVGFVDSCLKEPFFNWDLFPLVKEEFDHSLQLFMSFSKDGWGTTATTSLQAGVVAEQNHSNVEENSDPYLRMAKKVWQNKGDLQNVLEQESEKY